MPNETAAAVWQQGDGTAAACPRISSPEKMPGWDQAIKLLVPAGLAVLLVFALRFGSLSAYWQLFSAKTYAHLLPALAAAYSLALLLFQALRTILWLRYKPYPPAEGRLPPLTVIIPAYNEGAMVQQAIDAVLAADYPAEKLEIICIDDGSTDDTWSYIHRACRQYPGRLTPIRFRGNRGKKEALYAGFTRGRGEVYATIDSDSIIDRAALRHLVAPLLAEPRIGAVAGNVKVFNRHQSLMGKMQAVRFVNLDYLRASQSLYRAVICTPGSLSAYRRAALRPILEAWRRQTFLGAPCRHSEDRALTNFILGGGHYTYYQRTAVVHTLVPETYRGVCRMYLRWERGNVREACRQLRYLFTKYRPKYRLMPIVEFFLTGLEFPFTFLFFGLLITSVICYPAILFKLLIALGIMSLVNLGYYLRLERSWDFVYGVVYSYFAFFTLQWIYPYAFFTVRDTRWLTR